MKIFQKPHGLDALVLSVFACLITFQPYYLHGQINIFELGIYLPGIQSILHTGVPYRDFFYLRGPFELYMPAFLMHLFGENVAVLMSYFYVGTVMTLLMCVVLGRQLLTTRLFYYLAIPVLVAKTFPRVVFTYWGGMRFALGLLAIACGVQYFKSKKTFWIFASGVATALSLWTSIEIGVYASIALVMTLVFGMLTNVIVRKDGVKLLILFFGGFLFIGLPYSIYLNIHSAFLPYLEATVNVIQNMDRTFPQVEAVPKNLMEAMGAMINPDNKSFRHLTPAYLYLFLTIYFAAKIRSKKIRFSDCAVVCLAIYGFVFFIGSFRNIWASQFEMALQPEKLLLFFLLEQIFFYLRGRRDLILPPIKDHATLLWRERTKIYMVSLFMWAVIISSVGYSIQRYNKRFFAFKFVRNSILGKETDYLKPLHGTDKTELTIDRVKGLTVPSWQAQDFIELTRFIHKRTSVQDTVLIYPEGGTYSFIIDRPFVGRFPMATFSWFNEASHKEYLKSLAELKPPFAVIPKTLSEDFLRTHFIVDANKQKYDELMRYIEEHYLIVASTSTLNILALQRIIPNSAKSHHK